MILKGDTAAVERAESRLRKTCDGYYRLRSGVWLGDTNVTPSELRDVLGDDNAGLRLLVAKLDGRWAAKGHSEVVDWLRDARDEF